jgi:hypothetical protein
MKVARTGAGVRKPPMEETAGGEVARQTLWGFVLGPLRASVR